MKIVLVLILGFFLSGCALFQKKPQEICTPQAPIVKTEYATLPDYLFEGCVRPKKFPMDMSEIDLYRIIAEREKEHNLCADRLEIIKERNDEFKSKLQ